MPDFVYARRKKLIASALCSLFVTSCGSSNNDSPAIENTSSSATTSSQTMSSSSASVIASKAGIIKGIPAITMYQSGSLSGTVGESGEFNYETLNGTEQSVAFSLAGITYAEVTGKPLLTIQDLVGDFSIENTELLNILGFFTLFDADHDASNGYRLSSELEDALGSFTWSQPDFSDSDFYNQSAISTVISDIASIEQTAPTVPTKNALQQQLENSNRCLSSGVFTGTFSGDDTGTFVLGVDSANGNVGAFGHSTLENTLFLTKFEEGTPITINSNNAFISGGVSTGATFTGTISDYSMLNGTWRNLIFDESGVFTATKVAANYNEYLRYTLVFTDGNTNATDDVPQNFGLIALSVSADDSVSATMVDSAGTQTALSGSLSGNDLVLSSSDNTISVTGYLARNGSENPSGDIPAFGGSWSNSTTGVAAGVGISFGSGCRIF